MGIIFKKSYSLYFEKFINKYFFNINNLILARIVNR